MVTIKKETENKLLKRKEIVVEISNDGATISKQEIKSQLAKKLKADEKLIIINRIDSHFGSTLSSITAYLYEDEETIKKVSLKHILKRNEAPAQEVEAQEA